MVRNDVLSAEFSSRQCHEVSEDKTGLIKIGIMPSLNQESALCSASYLILLFGGR